MIVRDKPELSVIIVNYFSERKLLGCLRSLDAEREPVEVVVADNGSNSQNRASLVAAYPRVRWHSSGGNAGFAVASNIGAARAVSDKLLFLNPDTIVLPGTFSPLIRTLGSAGVGRCILGCSVLDEDGAPQLSCRRFPDWRTIVAGRFSLLTRLFPANSWSVRYLMRDFGHDSNRRVDWVSGAAMAMSRATFEELGGFDEIFFMYFEDVDLCRRAAELGIPTLYFPEARVEHQIGGSSREVPVRALTYRHRSMWGYYRRYHGRLWLNPFAALLILGRLAMLVTGHAMAQLAMPIRQPEFRAQKTVD